ncbi:FG-GAP repeat domain-containing protein [Rhizohabitans arisaemae]|uniref:FG-GAP repeat domain-containing protein n=1 Tax=Rhizohabitans arisaemae TaxID=2720610 RepID=UPI0024B076D0|nr:VCBS repeat-containing protein [Rhizohabitans arisaemae]
MSRLKPPIRSLARRNAAGFLAVGASLAVWAATCLPTSDAARTRLGREFRFEAVPLGAPDRPEDRRLRPVAPSYEGVRAWISSVGAGVALFDLGGDGVSDDVCLVDPRTDTVTVQPAPGSGARYRPFVLRPPDAAPYEAPMGCLPADLNEDGRQDVVVYYWGRSPSVFLRKPAERPARIAFQHQNLLDRPQIWNTNAATLGDYDGDGHLDLVFGNYFPEGARVLDPTGDHGNIVMPDSLSGGRNGGTNRLLRFTGTSRGAVRFEEVKGVFDSGAGAWTLALGTQDLDGDFRPDLYVANDFAPDQLLINESEPGRIRFRAARGTRHLATPKSKVVGGDSFKGMGVAFTDLNADEIPDILVSNITEPYALQESNFAFVSTGSRDMHRGHAPYDDRSEELGLSRSGWSWDVKAADFNNDGVDEVMHATGFVRGTVNRWAQLQETATSNDLIVAHPGLWPYIRAGDDLSGRNANTFFARTDDGRYVDAARRVGVGTEAVSRGFAVGDVQGDGRLDFAVANQWGQSTLYLNRSEHSPFLGLRLKLPTGVCPQGPGLRTALPARPAIGAVARLVPATGAPQVRQLYPANGHGGVSAPDLLFGLSGQTTANPVRVDLSWRDACGRIHKTTETFAPGWHQVLLTSDGRARKVAER